MEVSKETLERKARDLGFEARYLDKVNRLLTILRLIMEYEGLSKDLVLKGGTAINLFHLQLPRLSVDIDLNYVGELDVERMTENRQRVIEALESIFKRADLSINNEPNYDEHAGLTWELSYHSPIVGRDNVKVDLNFLMRSPIFPVKDKGLTELSDFSTLQFRTHDLHELAGGKLRALFQRSASRDLYDVYRLLQDADFKKEWLRIAFVVYGAAAKEDWRGISLDDIGYELQELKDDLEPVLRKQEREGIDNFQIWAEDLVGSCRKRLHMILPFTDKEIEFLDGVIDKGEIQPELLTEDEEIQKAIRQNPGLQWKIRNVREHFGLDQ